MLKVRMNYLFKVVFLLFVIISICSAYRGRHYYKKQSYKDNSNNYWHASGESEETLAQRDNADDEIHDNHEANMHKARRNYYLQRKYKTLFTTGFVAPKCIEKNHYDDDKPHECDRPCRENDRRICYYRFVLESFESHNPKACGAHCAHYHNCHKCIVTDGVRTPLLVTNYRSPLKPVVACKDDIIEVDVVNHLTNFTMQLTEKNLEKKIRNHLRSFKVKDSSWHAFVLAASFLHKRHLHHHVWAPKYMHSSPSNNYGKHHKYSDDDDDSLDVPGEPTSIHWHGILQKHTPCADGVPYVTQAPIKPGMIYRYRLKADHAGTSFAHSHYSFQRGLGLAGPMVIREANDPNAREYDYDLTAHNIFITDVAYNKTGRSDTFHINGHGLHKVGNDTAKWSGKPHVYYVKHGFRYRMRCVLNGIGNTPVVIKVDNHELLLIAVDGNAVKPRKFDSVVLNNAERVDLVLNTKQQKIDNYLIHVWAFDKPTLQQVAILRYKGAATELSRIELNKKPTPAKGLQFNTLDVPPKTEGTLLVSELESAKPVKNCVTAVKCKQIFVELSVSARGFQINHISMEYPEQPFLMQLYQNGKLDESNFCNAQTLKHRNCTKETCNCMHVVKLKLHACYEIVIIGRHPFHLHGYVFNVVAKGVAPAGKQMTKETFMEMDRQGLVERNLYNPPGKDTIAAPKNGFSVVRICTDNPGFWIAHCHIELHSVAGMAMVFMVGSAEDILRQKCLNHNSTPYNNNQCHA